MFVASMLPPRLGRGLSSQRGSMILFTLTQRTRRPDEVRGVVVPGTAGRAVEVVRPWVGAESLAGAG